MAKRITRLTRPWEAIEITYLLEYRPSGMSFEAIAHQLGRTKTAVMDKWRRIKPKPEPEVQTAPSLIPTVVVLSLLALLGFVGMVVALNAPVA